ncbi:MAG: sodium ion-translocating decarboxylase subunit beta [Candidatus Limivicinus sp.]
MDEAASIGIIGGADGPTAVFITANPETALIAAALAMAVIAVIVILFRRRNS